jgi:hypothetical protein
VPRNGPVHEQRAKPRGVAEHLVERHAHEVRLALVRAQVQLGRGAQLRGVEHTQPRVRLVLVFLIFRAC